MEVFLYDDYQLENPEHVPNIMVKFRKELYWFYNKLLFVSPDKFHAMVCMMYLSKNIEKWLI